MQNIRQFGVAVMSLSDLVDDFCLAQGNMRETGILAQYRHARWAWKDLFRTTLWNIRKAPLCVDCESGTIRLPDDCERLLAISVVDTFGKLHPLAFNSDWNTARLTCLKSCSCHKCNGQDTLCGAVDNIGVQTETVTIKGTDYTKTTLTRYDGNGGMQREQTIPAWDEQKAAVVYNKLTETICNVETTPGGCIAATKTNIEALQSNCGAGLLDGWMSNINPYRELAPTPYNYWGEFNFNAADPNIVHIFGGPAVSEYLGRVGSISQVIVDYQTNGETPNAEILIPEYAVNAVQTGMVYQQKFVHPRASEGDKLMAEYAYNRAKIKIMKYLNPIQLDGIMKMQTNARLW